MRKSFVVLAVAAVATLPATVNAAVISGPSLDFPDIAWVYTGIGFSAVQNATLRGFTVQTQGQADTVYLTDTDGNILQSVAVAAGPSTQTFNVSWSLTAGTGYRLLQSTASNGRYTSWNLPAPANADIALTQTGIFSGNITITQSDIGLPIFSNEYWTTFNDITTSSGAVPEPASWALMVVGFGLAGAALRRRQPIAA